MTVHIYRYRQGPNFDNALLQKLVHTGATISDFAGGPKVDLSCDDSRLTDLDEMMAQRGYTRTATDPVGTPPSEIRLSDGTIVPFGAIADTQFLQRVSGAIIGVAATFDQRDVVLFDHFTSSNSTSDRIGQQGWRSSLTGGGSAVNVLAETGHPGIIQLASGTAGNGRCAIDMGNAGFENILASGANSLVYESLISFRGIITAAGLIRHQLGLGAGWALASPNPLTDGIYFRLEPGLSTSLFGVVRSGGVETTRNLGTVPVLSNWYRPGFTWSPGGGTPQVQFRLNGTDQGAVVTTNIPSARLGAGFRVDSNGTATSPDQYVDYVLITQVTNKET